MNEDEEPAGRADERDRRQLLVRLRSGAAIALAPSVAASASAQTAAAAQPAAEQRAPAQASGERRSPGDRRAAEGEGGPDARRPAQVERADERCRADVDERIAVVERGAEQMTGEHDDRPARERRGERPAPGPRVGRLSTAARGRLGDECHHAVRLSAQLQRIAAAPAAFRGS